MSQYVALRCDRGPSRGSELHGVTVKGIEESLRSLAGGRPPSNRIYVLTPMVCGECGGQATAAGNGRYRCRVSADKSGRCSQPSVRAEVLEAQADAWITGALRITPAIESEYSRLITERTAKASDAQHVADIKRRMARLGDRYEAGDPTLSRESYLERMRELKAELERAERQDDRRAALDALRHVRDFAGLYADTTPTRRRELWRFVFSRVVLKDKQLVRVRPNELLMPLFAATLQQRSRPDSNRRSRP